MHAVGLLNADDGGSRQSILITNNEVSVNEAAELRERGLKPGDADWEAQGIFQHVTRRRVEAAITGLTPGGEPVPGEYIGTGLPMADGLVENAEFFGLF